MSDYIREWLPPGVLNVVTGGHDFGPWMTSHSGIDLITFTRSRNIGKRVLESAAGSRTSELLENRRSGKHASRFGKISRWLLK
jgi:acyl-CoA reductase-like NAD-dependent aldehyde dehydrogenase